MTGNGSPRPGIILSPLSISISILCRPSSLSPARTVSNASVRERKPCHRVNEPRLGEAVLSNNHFVSVRSSLVGAGAGSQCFPYFAYSLDGDQRRDGIADRGITKWEIFYYIYGLLHHPLYQSSFADALKRHLPVVCGLPGLQERRGRRVPGPLMARPC
jgi:hypothetical protein